MSVLQNDKEVLDSPKRTPLDVEVAPLRDQILLKLADKLAEKNIGQKVKDLWLGGNANRETWLERQAEYLREWDEFLIPQTGGPFEGSSNLHLPFPLIVAKTYHARFLQAVMGSDPVVKPRTEASIDRAGLVEDILVYTLKDWMNFDRGIFDVVDRWLWEWITVGSSIVKTRWECKYEKFLDVTVAPKQAGVRSQIDPETGQEIQVPIIEMKEQEVERTYKWEGPVAEWISHEDVLLIGGGGDPQLADAVIHRDRLTASQLWTLADRKVFDKEVVEEIINGGPDLQQGDQIKQTRADNAGKGSVDTEYDLDRYEILEAYLPVDVDGSGINSEIVVWVHARSGQICRATYLRRIHKSGERPFSKIDFHLRPGSEYGVGLIEMIYPLAKELDALHNMRIDAGIISNMPIGFYRPSSSLDPVKLEYTPGTLIPLDNPQSDIYFPTFSNKTAWGFQEEQALQTWAERLTGLNDMSFGVLTGAQGATRTATGARALMGESNANLDVFLRRLNRGWTQFLECLLHMLQQRIPAGLSFRITGESGDDYFGKIRNSEEIAGDYDLIVEGNSANTNKQIQLEVANQVVANTSNPLDIQLGIVTPEKRYEALKTWYKANGIKEYRRYIQAPPEYQYIPTPAEEIDRLQRGIQVPVLPNSDHQGYLSLWEEYKGSDELLGQMSQEAAVACEQQARQHMEMLAALEQMQAQQSNASQMQQNAVNSQQQAPVGLNPMAGGMNNVGA